MSNLPLDPDDAKGLVYGGHVAIQEVSRHRWYTKRLVVFKRDGRLVGFHYLDPASEEQDGQDVFENDPVPVFPVTAREITTTVYSSA